MKKITKAQLVHPKVLDLGFKQFTIEQVSLKKDNLYGCVEFPKALISIDPDQSLPDYKGTLLHEILHVGWDLFGLGDDEEMPTIGNEYLTTTSSNILQLLAGLNPQLFAYIFTDE